MSDEKKDLSLLDQMKKQHGIYSQQRDQAHANVQQLIGAIYALETLIKSHEEELKKIPPVPPAAEGEQGDGETNEQAEGQAA